MGAMLEASLGPDMVARYVVVAVAGSKRWDLGVSAGTRGSRRLSSVGRCSRCDTATRYVKLMISSAGYITYIPGPQNAWL